MIGTLIIRQLREIARLSIVPVVRETLEAASDLLIEQWREIEKLRADNESLRTVIDAQQKERSEWTP